jgi:hypothetical protein
MKVEITGLLALQPGLSGRLIAKGLGLSKKDVNSFLYADKDNYFECCDYKWYLKSVCIEFPSCSWLDTHKYENSINAAPDLWPSNALPVRFVFSDCKFLLSTLSRLIALVNQLADLGKSVTLDFQNCKKSFSYLCRVHIFEVIDKSVQVYPKVPKTSYTSCNSSVMKFGVIEPLLPDEGIPLQLKKSFIHLAGQEHSNAAFTIISELFGNVRDHSKSSLSGFAALQVYGGRRKHIQTVISDSGEGIAVTLRHVLQSRYPHLHSKYPVSNPESDALLIKEVFDKGGVSSAPDNEDNSRGLGLKCSGNIAARFDAEICIRQDLFELTLYYKNGKLDDHSVCYEVKKLKGTHICFDFFLE